MRVSPAPRASRRARAIAGGAVALGLALAGASRPVGAFAASNTSAASPRVLPVPGQAGSTAAPTAAPTSAPAPAPSSGVTGSKSTVSAPPATAAAGPASSSPATASPATAARARTASTAATVPATTKRSATVASPVSTLATAVASTPAPEATVTTPPSTVAAADGATSAAAAPTTTAAPDVGDPGATRTVRGIAWALLAMAAVLAGLMAWFWRLTRPVPAPLGGLAVMGTTRWRRSPRHMQDELVTSARAEPIEHGPPLPLGGTVLGSLGAGPAIDPIPAAAVERDEELAPIVPAEPVGSFEWPPAASDEEIAALGATYGWNRAARRTVDLAPVSSPTGAVVTPPSPPPVPPAAGVPLPPPIVAAEATERADAGS